MLARITRCNMETLSRSHVWIAAAALMAALGVGAGAGAGARRPFTPSDSILDIINTDQVEKILAQRESEHAAGVPSTAYYQRSDINDENGGSMIITVPDQEDNTELPQDIDYRKVLKSSKNALVVTKKEYLKNDWCKTKTLVQKIREPGCLPVTVINKFCYGQCNSFYIPKGPRRRDNDERPPPAFKSCSFCRPKKVSWMTVKLHCPGQNPPFRNKRLQKIKQCKCLPVAVN